jgi:mannose-6-phosphate isomerase-like protein (cupin superfamily)
VIGRVGGETDTPVLVAIPAIVKHVRLGFDVGVHRAVEITVKSFPFSVGPPFETQVIGQSAQCQVVTERDVTGANRSIHQLECLVPGPPSQLGVVLDGGDKRLRNDRRQVARIRLARHAYHPLVFCRTPLSQRPQLGPRAKQAGVGVGDRMSILCGHERRGKQNGHESQRAGDRGANAHGGQNGLLHGSGLEMLPDGKYGVPATRRRGPRDVGLGYIDWERPGIREASSARLNRTTCQAVAHPPHVHQREDETFQILEGEYEWTVGDKTFIASKGATIFAPRGVPHSYRYLGKTPGRLMCVITPSGFEGFFEEIGALSPQLQQNVPRVLEIAKRYGLDILPPPGA